MIFGIYSCFSYSEGNYKMDCRYRRYSSSIPQYLLNRPHYFVKHCLLKIELAKKADMSGVVMKSEGEFLVHSFEDYHQSYTVQFGNDDKMPKCSCPDWSHSMYLCKHFFAVFRKFPKTWSWDALSVLYRNSPFLTLDVGMTEDELQAQENMPLVTDVMESNYEDVMECNDEDVMERKDEYVDDREIKEKKQDVQYGPMVRDVITQLRNISYELENDENKGIYESLSLILSNSEKLRKTEDSLPVLPNQHQTKAKKPKYLRLSLNKKRKSNPRVGEKNEKKKKAKVIKVEDESSKVLKENKQGMVIEECVVDNQGVGEDQFETRELIFIDSSSGDEDLILKDCPHYRSSLSQSDLKELSNNNMLNDNVLHVFQKMLSKKYPLINGLQDTVLGQTLAYDVMGSRPFLQVKTKVNYFYLNLNLETFYLIIP